MINFQLGSEHIAHAPMTNNTPKTWTYDAEFYLVKGGTTYTSSGTITFSLDAGASQTIDFPITMPSIEGTYQVFLDIYVAGELIGAYQAIEDVTIGEIVPVGFVYSNITCSDNPIANTNNSLIVVDATITNNEAIEQTCNVKLQTVRNWKVYKSDGEVPIVREKILDLTIAPGESYQYHGDFPVSRSYYTYILSSFFEDSNGGGGKAGPRCDCYVD